MMEYFPAEIERILKEIADEMQILLAKETHMESNNRVFSFYHKKIRTRLDFEPFTNHVTVDLYIDRFLFCPKIFIFLSSVIPLFPDFSKIEFRELDPLPLGETDSFYRNKIYSYIESAIKYARLGTFGNKNEPRSAD